MRIVVARCSVTYAGRLGARLGEAVRVVMIKRDGSLAIHADAKAYKPLNWMNPPCTIVVGEHQIVCENAKGETLSIDLAEILHDLELDLGDDPGLEKDGVETELQELLARDVGVIGKDFVLVRREYPTDIGPVDLLCRDPNGNAIVVEVKRVGEIAGVDQLLRYQERLDLDARLRPTKGVLVATRIKPQARIYAESRGVACVEITLDQLRHDTAPELKLF